MNISVAEVKRQLHRLELTGFDRRLSTAAKAHRLPVAYLYGIASRETNCRHELGDFRDGEYHGVSIIQIDIQHEIARRMRDDGTWETNPQPLIDYGAALLLKNLRLATDAFPDFTTVQHLKISASGYNCSMPTAIRAAEQGDSDLHTTPYRPGGKPDYGADVMARTHVFAVLIGETL